ncbi:MAG TPA: type II toxin-antitoxin system VapC family toxin [Acetobacteraceae bacterium]|nr:type II toxin-antitoxin system VapC family toxin [Acetobacteraceae bacterium]
MISAGTVAEAMIVAARRNVGQEMQRLIDELGFEIGDVSFVSAMRVAAGYGRRGKGLHPASLNFGDCFAYEVAKNHHCQPLYVGNDFARTDIEAAI